MGKGSALDGFFSHYDGTGNSDAVVIERVHTKLTLDDELVQVCHRHGDKPHRGTALGQLPELWPFDMLKRPLIAQAETFVEQIGGQGYIPATSIYEFEIWGPYMEKVSEPTQWVPEADNPLIPDWAKKKAHKAWGYQGNELRFDKGCTFIIVGQFFRAAKHGHISEETGGILV